MDLSIFKYISVLKPGQTQKGSGIQYEQIDLFR